MHGSAPWMLGAITAEVVALRLLPGPGRAELAHTLGRPQNRQPDCGRLKKGGPKGQPPPQTPLK